MFKTKQVLNKASKHEERNQHADILHPNVSTIWFCRLSVNYSSTEITYNSLQEAAFQRMAEAVNFTMTSLGITSEIFDMNSTIL